MPDEITERILKLINFKLRAFHRRNICRDSSELLNLNEVLKEYGFCINSKDLVEIVGILKLPTQYGAAYISIYTLGENNTAVNRINKFSLNIIWFVSNTKDVDIYYPPHIQEVMQCGKSIGNVSEWLDGALTRKIILS